MKIINALMKRLISLIKLKISGLLSSGKLNVALESMISFSTKISLGKNGYLSIGKKVGTRKNVEISVAENAEIKIGNRCFFNNNCMIVSHEKITIGEGCSFGPNVLIYDHDHDFRVEGGLKKGKFKKTPIIIGNNVWIGANTVILRGTTIGDDCVIAAGSVIKGNFENNKIIFNSRETIEKNI